MESVHADILLHVIDATDAKMYQKINIVEEILKNLGIENTKQIYVFNKTEELPKNVIDFLTENFASKNPQFISAKEGTGINNIISKLSTLI